VASNSDQFRQAFREEARELLVDLEAALLELNERRDDSELVARVFRSLHTIKGSGAMFGFDRLAAFTHKLENAYDAVRTGQLAIGEELIDLTLKALDQIGALLEESGDDAEAQEKLLRRLGALQSGATESVAADGEKAQHVQPATDEQTECQLWKIRFAPGPELMRRGSDPLLLLRELAQLGAMAARPSTGSIPALSEIDPERCYLEWEMTLATAAGREAIRDVFIFVEDDCELSLEPELEPETAKAKTAPEADRIAVGLEEKRTLSGRRNYDKPENATTLRVPAAKLDQFVDLVGELVTVQARLSGLAAERDDAEVGAVAEEIERLTSALRENSMRIRMLPIRATFEKFRRLVHDLARDLGKDVELTIEGADTELDKTVIEQLGDPLMHLIRNSMDHGIEPPDERTGHGKPATAKIHLEARHAGASVLISVSDDGRGIDAEAVRTRAVERGLVAADAALSEAEIHALIFRPGFSTAQQVTDVSGRGVGMDVVRQRVDGLRGTIEVNSKRGAGTSVVLRLPLTLAIIDGLLVCVGEARFVLPLAATLECIELTRADVERAHGRHVVNVRGEVIPYIRLREQFQMGTDAPEMEQIMVAETAVGHCGIVVDRVLGDCQTVIKNLGSFYRHVKVVSGATILGDGTVALILDPERLVEEVQRNEARRGGGRRAEIRSAAPAVTGAAKTIHGERSAGATASA